MASPFA
jgi:hypothetical protein